MAKLEAKFLKINRSDYRIKLLHKVSTARWFVLDYDQGVFYYKDKIDDDKNWSGVTSLSKIERAEIIQEESHKDLFGFSVLVAGNVHVEAMCPATITTSSRCVADHWVAELNRIARTTRQADGKNHSGLAKEDKVKLIVIGDAGVGKTCLARGYVGADTDGKVTLGVDFLTKRVIVDGAPVKLQIFDTAGQEKYNSMNRLYYRDAQVVFIVFDLTQQRSFDECEMWLQQARTHCNVCAPVVVLIGNKRDMTEVRQVSAESAASYARSNNLEYFETAALFKDNVDTVFKSALQHWSKSPPSVPPGQDSWPLLAGRDRHINIPLDDELGNNRCWLAQLICKA